MEHERSFLACRAQFFSLISAKSKGSKVSRDPATPTMWETRLQKSRPEDKTSSETRRRLWRSGIRRYNGRGVVEQNTTTESHYTWLRYFPAAGYIVAQVFFIVALWATLIQLGLSLWPLYPDPVAFLWVFLPASLPSIVVGVLDGLARLPRRLAWAIPLRVVSSVFVAALGVGISLLGGLFMNFDDQPFTGEPVLVGTYLGTLAGMEAALALSWFTATRVVKIHHSRGQHR